MAHKGEKQTHTKSRKMDPQIVITCGCGEQKWFSPFDTRFQHYDNGMRTIDWNKIEKLLEKDGWMEDIKDGEGWFCSEKCFAKKEKFKQEAMDASF
jgi:hypothetical protein